MTISPQPTDTTPQALREACAMLEQVRAGAYATSDRSFGRGMAFALDLLRDALEIDADRHWYVDAGGFCAACNLPESNGRHVRRTDA